MRAEALKMSPFELGWEIGLWYGLGVMDLRHWTGQTQFSFVGHGGDTYGFNALTGYSSEYDAGISIVANTENALVISKLMQQVYSVVASYVSSKATASSLSIV